MLTSLHISGYALIDTLDVEFGPGLNIITGETGAGKSILIGALKMILGGRASADLIRVGAKKAVIEGQFVVEQTASIRTLLDDYANEDLSHLILRREIAEGGSRAFVNDYPVPVSVLKEIASEIIDLHGQHDQQSLLRRETHVALLDLYGRHQGLLDSYAAELTTLAELEEQIEELRRRERDLQERQELHGFQLNEIDSVDPDSSEEDRLNRDRRVLENAERLRETATKAYDGLYGDADSIYDRLAEVRRSLHDAIRIDESINEFWKELETAAISIDEVAKELSAYADGIESDEGRLDELRERLGQLDALKRKYGGTIEAVLDYREQIRSSLSETLSVGESIRDLLERLRDAGRRLSELALELSSRRQAVAKEVETRIVEELDTLGMARSQFCVKFERQADKDGWVQDAAEQCFHAFADGIDRIEFLLSTNPGEPVRSLRKVASGGEISRIMLAVKQILAQRDSLPILVFDEIDVGISGSIAQRVGERMSALARRHQLITITHLPQIAACADSHYVVEKEESGARTRTSIRQLTVDEQAVQVASLISGTEVTEAGLTSARELMKSHQN